MLPPLTVVFFWINSFITSSNSRLIILFSSQFTPHFRLLLLLFSPSFIFLSATRAYFSSYVSLYLRFNSFATNLIYFYLCSFNYLYYAMILCRIWRFSNFYSSSIAKKFSFRWSRRALIFLSGRNYLLFPIATRHKGHSFLPKRL